MNKKIIPVMLGFLCMGFGDAVGPFVGLAKEEFVLSNFVAMIIPFTGFIMFGILSIPMGVFQGHRGKKTTMIIGLVVALLGLVIPMFGLSKFYMFLATILLVGAGATILQVAGNPILRDVSAEGKYSRNMSLAQFVKAIGSLMGPVLPPVIAALFGTDWKMLFPIFSVSMLITLVYLMMTKIDEHQDENSEPTTFKSSFALMKDGYVAMMVLGIFVYVGAEVCMSSGIPLYLEANFGIDLAKYGILGTGLFFTALMLGRFGGGVILNWIKPEKFFIITAIMSIVGIGGLFIANQVLAIISVIIVGLSFANIFPLAFTIAAEKMPEKINELSGLMVTAVCGGAFLPLLMGFVQDHSTVTLGFLVPLASIFYITFLAFKNK